MPEVIEKNGNPKYRISMVKNGQGDNLFIQKMYTDNKTGEMKPGKGIFIEAELALEVLEVANDVLTNEVAVEVDW